MGKGLHKEPALGNCVRQMCGRVSAVLKFGDTDGAEVCHPVKSPKSHLIQRIDTAEVSTVIFHRGISTA